MGKQIKVKKTSHAVVLVSDRLRGWLRSIHFRFQRLDFDRPIECARSIGEIGRCLKAFASFI